VHKFKLSLFITLVTGFSLLSANSVIAQRPIQKPGEIRKPGEIQQPKGKWQTPGEIQVPKGIQAIKTQNSQCQQRLTIGADTLFEFNKSSLTADAEETLKALGPMITKAGKHPILIEGHTDSVGSNDYNQRLSESRAKTVKDWLAAHHYVPETSSFKALGETKPIAPNAKPDGSDNPEGRQKNRRVEIVIDTCH